MYTKLYNFLAASVCGISKGTYQQRDVIVAASIQYELNCHFGIEIFSYTSCFEIRLSKKGYPEYTSFGQHRVVL